MSKTRDFIDIGKFILILAGFWILYNILKKDGWIDIPQDPRQEHLFMLTEPVGEERNQLVIDYWEKAGFTAALFNSPESLYRYIPWQMPENPAGKAALLWHMYSNTMPVDVPGIVDFSVGPLIFFLEQLHLGNPVVEDERFELARNWAINQVVIVGGGAPGVDPWNW